MRVLKVKRRNFKNFQMMWTTFLMLSGWATAAQSANILGIVPLPPRSHNILFQRLMIALAETGHNVTFLSHMPQKKLVPNLTDIYLPYDSSTALSDLKLDLFSLRFVSAIQHISVISNYGLMVSENQLKSEEMQRLLKSDSSFDVILAEGFLSESISAGLAHRFKAPTIAFMTFQPSVWCNYFVGNEAPSSYIPDPFVGYPQEMTFLQRLYNFVVLTIGTLNLHLLYLPKHQVLLRQHFGDTVPPIEDIIRNTSLVFVNDHFSLSYARPLVPNMIPIGGVHVYPPKKLPSDLQTYLENAKEGAILFSLGSNLQSSMMPKEKIEMFKKVFSQLREKVLWKFEDDLTGMPDNVLASSWLPQSDILAHRNLKLFITHGGLLSTTESIERGVPVLGIPIFADQPMNMRHAVNAGFGLSLNYDELSAEGLLSTIRELLKNPKYREAAQLRSRLLKDQPKTPLDTAVWWTEYVIRHRGAPHLRSPAQDLAWYQKQQLDVVAALLTTVLFTFFASIKTTRILVAVIRQKIVRHSMDKKSN